MKAAAPPVVARVRAAMTERNALSRRLQVIAKQTDQLESKMAALERDREHVASRLAAIDEAFAALEAFTPAPKPPKRKYTRRAPLAVAS